MSDDAPDANWVTFALENAGHSPGFMKAVGEEERRRIMDLVTEYLRGGFGFIVFDPEAREEDANDDGSVRVPFTGLQAKVYARWDPLTMELVIMLAEEW